MSLTNQQKADLTQLSKYFNSLDKMAVESNIDLDVFISEYKDNGYAIYATEQVSIEEKAKSRQQIFKGEKDKVAEKKKVHVRK